MESKGRRFAIAKSVNYWSLSHEHLISTSRRKRLINFRDLISAESGRLYL